MDSQTFQNLKGLYFFLDQNFDSLIAKCTTDDQRQQLRQDYIVARDSFYQARNLIFHDDDPTVGSLNQQLTDDQKQMASMLAGLQEVAKILSLATDAVSLASRLLALASIA